VHRRDDGALVWSGSDIVFGDATRANPDFTLFPEALVRRVVVEDGRAIGVVVTDRTDGTDHEVRARYVVVAADAFRTPQVLFASGVRPEALGRYLNDQPQVVFAVRLRDVAPSAVEHEDPRGRTEIVGEGGVSWVPFTDAEPFHGQVMQLDASPIPLVGEDEPAPGTIVGLGWFCAKDVRAEDRIEFSDEERDEFGMPKPRIHYVLTQKDRASLEAAKAAIVRAARVLGDFIGDAPLELSPGASLHYQGSTRMGETDDGRSVCGPNSEVWGVDGLYVAGNGVIPTPIACNPTLTSVALAVRGARDIAERIAAQVGARVTA
jgi:choline dehydrogenase-like flavoprotein